MTESVVLSEVSERGIATVTLNRPDLHNAYNGAVVAGLSSALKALAADAAVRVLVLRGNGKYFQAGADLAFLKEIAGKPPEEGIAFSRLTEATVDGLRRFPRPTVALVHGGCFGGGIGLVAACDMAIATTDTVFSISEVRWGLTPAVIMGAVTRRLGPRALGRFALSGERFNAAEALRMGLIHQVCAPGMLDEAAGPMIEALLTCAPEAVAKTKALIEESILHDGERGFSDELIQEAASRRRLPEAAEGVASFSEKRPPSWYPQKK